MINIVTSLLSIISVLTIMSYMENQRGKAWVGVLVACIVLNDFNDKRDGWDWVLAVILLGIAMMYFRSSLKEEV